MADPNRDERRLMRQRGAGTRNINNNIEFGLSFPTPTNARVSKTPFTGRKSLARVEKATTHEVAPEELVSTTQVSPQLSTVNRGKKRKSSFLDAVTDGSSPLMSKKRRLGDVAVSPGGSGVRDSSIRLSDDRRPSSGRRSLRKSDVIAIVEDVNNIDLPAVEEEPEDETENLTEDSTLNLHEDKENEEPTTEAAQEKRKKRKSAARRFSRPKKRISTESAEARPVQPAHLAAYPTQIASHQESARSPSIEDASLLNENLGSVQPEPLTMRVTQGNSTIATTRTSTPGEQIEIPRVTDRMSPESHGIEKSRLASRTPAESETNQVEDSTISAQSNGTSKKRRKRKSVVVKKRPGRRVSVQLARSASPNLHHSRLLPSHATSPGPTTYQEGSEDEDETYVPEDASPEPPTPAPAKKPRKGTKGAENNNSLKPAPRRQRSHSSEPRQTGFPITTHRLANISALPTISEENDPNSDSDFDELTSIHNRSAPNSVDVLSQLCRETVANTIASFRSSSSAAGTKKSSLQRQTAALTAFGDELHSRLFDMSAAVENRLTLEARVRAARRQRNELQARWTEVRREREEVALRMDRVRREHWEAEERGMANWALSENCFALELAVEKDMVGNMNNSETQRDHESLEYLLGAVKRDVSAWEGGGVLTRVKEFNKGLERLVTVLEAGEG